MPMPLAETDVDFLRSLVARRSGNVLTNGHGYLLESRLTPVAASIGLPNVAALVAELKRTPVKYEDLVAEAMTINETSFFRDAQPFETLRTDVLPSLLNTRNATQELSIWCAASSSGQEPYSIAMTLREHFPQLIGWKVKILATDISDEMLRRTRAGTYSQFEVNRGLPAKMLVKYFERRGTQWQVKEELRRWVEIRKMNLTGAWWPMPKFDIVFMRNVLIYFDRANKQTILQKTARTMAAGSALFLGGGESLVSLDVPFTRETFEKTVCFRPISATTPFPATSIRFPVPTTTTARTNP